MEENNNVTNQPTVEPINTIPPKKSNTGYIIVIIVLSILLLAAGGYIISTNILKNEENNTTTTKVTNNKEEETTTQIITTTTKVNNAEIIEKGSFDFESRELLETNKATIQSFNKNIEVTFSTTEVNQLFADGTFYFDGKKIDEFGCGFNYEVFKGNDGNFYMIVEERHGCTSSGEKYMVLDSTGNKLIEFDNHLSTEDGYQIGGILGINDDYYKIENGKFYYYEGVKDGFDKSTYTQKANYYEVSFENGKAIKKLVKTVDGMLVNEDA